ncbi:MAG: shikimate kinase [Nitrosopumilus sp.]
MAKAMATVHGAISLVNAIANQKGATLGIALKVEATVETSSGKGIILQSKNKSLSSRLINKTVEKIISKKDLEKNKITITLDSEIPTGFGLKSSSAISSAVALACAKIFKPKFTDQQVLLAGVDASIESRVSITGAFDDACSCYYGGFNVTDNAKRKRIHFEKGPTNLVVVIFIPKNRKIDQEGYLLLVQKKFQYRLRRRVIFKKIQNQRGDHQSYKKYRQERKVAQEAVRDILK